MGAAPISGLVYACFTHIPLWLEFPAYVTPLYLGGAQGEGRLNLRDLAPEWERHHPVLGGVVGSFALKRYVQLHHPEASRIGMCQYRKFISRRRVRPVPEPTYPVMDVVHKGDLAGDAMTRAMDPGVQPYLVSRPFAFGKGRKRLGILSQYARAHHVEDLLRFVAIAVELKVLDKDEVQPFFDELVFYPGGIELGIYEAVFWLRSIDAVERVVAACLASWPAHRDHYQTRAWAFCAERLGSWLLLQQFRRMDGGCEWARRHDWSQRVLPSGRYLGQMNLITENSGEGYVLGSVTGGSAKS